MEICRVPNCGIPRDRNSSFCYLCRNAFAECAGCKGVVRVGPDLGPVPRGGQIRCNECSVSRAKCDLCGEQGPPKTLKMFRHGQRGRTHQLVCPKCFMEKKPLLHLTIADIGLPEPGDPDALCQESLDHLMTLQQQQQTTGG